MLETGSDVEADAAYLVGGKNSGIEWFERPVHGSTVFLHYSNHFHHTFQPFIEITLELNEREQKNDTSQQKIT